MVNDVDLAAAPRHVSAALALLLAASACAVEPAPPFRAEVITMTGIDPGTELGVFEIAERDLQRITDLEQLTGPDFRIRRGGTLRVREVAGSVVMDGRFENGKSPGPRYHVEDGVVIARDYPTLSMLSVAHELDRVLELVPETTGMSLEDMLEGSGPVEVFFEPSIVVEAEDMTASMTWKRNAFALLGSFQFGLCQRSPLETVPLGANLKVLAHEFGHAVFFRVFAHGESDCQPSEEPGMFPGRWTTEYAIAGLNEGFADFYSFVVTTGTHPLAELREVLGDDRSLAKTTFTWSSLHLCEGGFYCLGTLFARSLLEVLRERGDAYKAAKRYAFSRTLVAAMKGVLPRMRAFGPEILPDAASEERACERREKLHELYDGRVAGAFLGALVLEMPEAERPALCEAFARNFGETGFPLAARAGCPPEAL